MSFFNGLFGSKKSGGTSAPARSAAPTADDTIKNMKGTQELLRKKQALLEAKITGEAENAKKLAALMKKNPRKKNEVMMCLKRKKMMENQYNQLDSQILNLEQTMFAMEKAILNQQIISAQSGAARVLKDQIKQVGDATDVEDMLADLDENVQEIDEIGNVLAQDLSFGNDMDEDELAAELSALEGDVDAEAADAFAAQLLGPAPGMPAAFNPVPDMPDVPISMPQVPQAQLADDDDAFAQLEADMMI